MLCITQVLLVLLLCKICLIVCSQAKYRLDTMIQCRWISEIVLYGVIGMIIYLLYNLIPQRLLLLAYIIVEWVIEPFLIIAGFSFVLSEVRSYYDNPK